MLNKQSNRTDNNRNSKYRESSGIYFPNPDQLIKDESACSLNLEQIINTLNIPFLKMYNRPLIPVEILLLKGIWQNKTYSEIATENNYSSDYLTNVAAPRLFKKLSKLVECRITKKSCCSIVTKYILENTSISSKSHEKEITKSRQSSNILSARYPSFEQKQNFDKNSFLKDAVLFFWTLKNVGNN